MSSFLPQHDPHPGRRSSDLATGQSKYVYNYTHVSPLAIADRVPWHDEFSFKWVETVSEHVLIALANRAEMAKDQHSRDHHLAKHSLLKKLVAIGETALHDIRHLVSEALRFEVRVGARPERPESLEDYGSLFRTIGLPPVTLNCYDDVAFGWMRVAGPNPLIIKRIRVLDERFPVTEELFQKTVPDDSLEAALSEDRVYLADYSVLDVESSNEYPHGKKYLYAPLAMFVVDRRTKRLRPVAIQCRQIPGVDNPICTPADRHNWLIAKLVVEMADGNVHEAFSHLGRTHLLMEPFVVSTCRQLASNHPLHVLLKPHFEGTLAINEAAWQHLVANKGAVDKLFSAPIEASRGLAAEAVQSAQVSQLQLPATFADRGVDDSVALPYYPFRDDALLYWQAIQRWVSEYLSLYYKSDADVAEDVELQAWGLELGSQNGGRLSGLPHQGQFRTRAELNDLVTFIIYTCSVQHAAVNFPQYDIMSYVPNMPLALYAEVPTSNSGATEADLLAMMPPLDMAELQMELGYLLGRTHYTQLGKYDSNCFADRKVAEPLAGFQSALSAIDSRIDERNADRVIPYTTLQSSGIPQSINI